MLKNFFIMFVLVAAGAVQAAQTTATGVSYSRDKNFIYVKQPLRVLLNGEQQAALNDGVGFIAKQLAKVKAPIANDPDGDLAALAEAAKEFDSKLNQLVKLSGDLYGDVAPYGIRLFQAAPSAIVIFGGAEIDKNVFRFIQGGGSLTIGAVLMPMHVTRISIKNPNEKITYIAWDSSLIVMPTLNAGPGISTQGGTNANARFGVGLIWGELGKASEFTGLTGGGSVTLAVGDGINLKALGLKNFDKPGFVSNYAIMAGIEKGQMAAGAGKLPFIKLNAESHFNLGWIYDAGATFSGISKFTGGVARRVTGPDPDEEGDKTP